MLPEIYYLADNLDLPYRATVPWPWTILHPQADWVNSMFALEDWLNQNVGNQEQEWAYAQQPGLEFTKACIAFRQDRYRTLFLLTWS